MRKKQISGATLLKAVACAGMLAAPCAAFQAFADPLPVTAPAADVKVTGTVTDTEGEPLIGVTVMVKGTSVGAATDIDGNYTINAPVGSELVFSYVGCVTKNVKVAKAGTLNIVLDSDSKLLDEMVVVGYGVQRKGDLTSSVASVKAEDFSQGKIGDAADLIKGKVAGLSIIKSSGAPDATSSIRLRGVTSLAGNSTPLVLIDGIEGELNTVAPENISEIDVLKDSSAAAIYGTRGANGVILITTKTGVREARAQASYSDYFSFSKWTKKADFMNTSDVIYGLTSQTYRGYDTDWLKAITRKSGFTHNHSFQISGGTTNATYAANVTYNKEEGIIRNTDNENLKMQLDYTQYLWNDILKVNLNILNTRQKLSANNGSAASAFRQAIIHNPSEPVYNDDGSYYEDFDKFQYYNPVEMLETVEGRTINRYTQMNGNITVEPIKGWQTKAALSWGESSSFSESFTHPEHYTLAREKNYNGYASKGESNGVSKSLEITSQYSANWNQKHRFQALVGYSYLYNYWSGFSAGNGNFSTLAYKWNNLHNGSLLTEEDRHATMDSYAGDNKLIGFFGRISYGYDNRYNVLVSLRHEGSSKFGANNKWANFPSVSAGWNIMNEEFMTESREWLNNLRLRVGYGVTGITPSDNYMSQYLYNFAGYGDILSMDGEWIKTLEVTQNYNPDLKWETTKEWNFGLDYGFLNDRLRGSVDFYVKTTDDLLFSYAVPVPPNMYGWTQYNVGSIRNTGIELAITGVPVQTRDFEWNTTVTLSHNRNKLLKLNSDIYETDNFQETGVPWIAFDPISVSTHCMEVGHGLGDFWGLKWVGYDKDGFALVEAKDADGNWVVKQFNANLNNLSNRQRLGNGTPKLFFGWNHQLTYKGFDLNLQFTGQFGYKILNAMRCFYQNNSIAYNRLSSAAEKVPAIDAKTLQPVLDAEGKQLYVTRSTSMGQGFWSEHLENGDFLKLQNVTLGYTIPLKGGVTKFVNNLRVYGSATNLFCITKYSGLDPEVSNYFMAPGVDDRDKYPTTRSYTVGLSFNF